MPCQSAKRQKQYQFGAVHRSHSRTTLMCHCKERSNVAP